MRPKAQKKSVATELGGSIPSAMAWPTKKKGIARGASGDEVGARRKDEKLAAVNLVAFGVHAALYEVVVRRALPKISSWIQKRCSKVRVLGVIPARYASTRFPGKPLADLCGNPMIWHTYTNAKKANLDELVVATDDERIAECVTEFGGKVVMTSESCNNGTERCLEVLQKLGTREFDVVVNIQGDEPFIEPEHIEKVVDCIRTGIEERDAGVVMSTLARPANVGDKDDVTNVNNVKVVLDQTNNALYFSRAMIPHNKKGKYDSKCLYWRKLGIYAYRASFLDTYVNVMPASHLQKQEDLEQNKVIEAGYKIKVGLVEKAVHGVDTPEQLRHLNGMLKTKKGIYI